MKRFAAWGTSKMRKHELSQHFLKSPKLALFLIGHSNIKKRDTVIDIGAGSGVITNALSRRCKQVIAVEADAETAKTLRKNLKDVENVKIVEQDFLEMDSQIRHSILAQQSYINSTRRKIRQRQSI